MPVPEFLYVKHSDPGPAGWRCSSDITYIERGIVDPRRLADFEGARNEHALFKRSPTGRYSKSKWLAFKAKILHEGVLSPIEIEKDGEGRITIFEGNHRVRAALSVGIPVPLVIRYVCNSQRLGFALPDVPRVALPNQAAQYASLILAAGVLSGKQSKRYRDMAAQILISSQPELRALAMSVALAEGAYSPK